VQENTLIHRLVVEFWQKIFKLVLSRKVCMEDCSLTNKLYSFTKLAIATVIMSYFRTPFRRIINVIYWKPEKKDDK